jgi:hypothetical protein
MGGGASTFEINKQIRCARDYAAPTELGWVQWGGFYKRGAPTELFSHTSRKPPERQAGSPPHYRLQEEHKTTMTQQGTSRSVASAACTARLSGMSAH